MWVYYDLDPTSPATLDRGGSTGADNAITVDTTTRTTFMIPNFAVMTQGVDVLAAADGVVEEAVDTWADDRTETTTGCDMDTNRIAIRTTNNYRFEYTSLRQGSASVSVGQSVAAGDTIAQVGSSECQSWPALRFRVRDCTGAPIDPFTSGLLRPADDMPYANPPSVLATAISDQPFGDVFSMRAPQPDATSTGLFGQVAGAITVADGRPGDEVSMRLLGPAGDLRQSGSVVFTRHYGWSWWTWNWVDLDTEGDWTFQYLLNGVEVDRRTYYVAAPLPP